MLNWSLLIVEILFVFDSHFQDEYETNQKQFFTGAYFYKHKKKLHVLFI